MKLRRPRQVQPEMLQAELITYNLLIVRAYMLVHGYRFIWYEKCTVLTYLSIP